MILFFQRDHDKAKSIRENEEKLIVSAWYNMVSVNANYPTEKRVRRHGLIYFLKVLNFDLQM